ncbi:SDR family NAD(P)-dependent oxidoreductase, partial [Acinetobacter baumannii]
DDVAEAAALLLLGAAVPDGPVTLTAPEAPRFVDLAERASDLAGRSIAYETLDAEEWVRRAVEAGQPEPQARFSLSIFAAAERGFFSGTDP